MVKDWMVAMMVESGVVDDRSCVGRLTTTSYDIGNECYTMKRSIKEVAHRWGSMYLAS